MVPDIVLQRLAFIRYVYDIAVEQSRQPEPLCGASILTFHDSVELFLQLAAEHLGAGTPPDHFMDYWKLFGPKIPNGGPTQKPSMARLNKARISLKHHGIIPSKLDIEAFRATATSFFEENTPPIFGIEFGAISMVALVRCPEARTSLEEASRLITKGKRTEAINMIAIAFHQIIEDYEKCNSMPPRGSPFTFIESFSSIGSSDMNLGDKQRKLADFVEKVIGSLGSLQDALRFIVLGIDYRRYAKFRWLTPIVDKSLSGKWFYSHNSRSTSLSVEECRYCFDFVIESALRMQSFELDLDWSWDSKRGLHRKTPS